jgi:D-alanyl-D-alanine dipeptidase
MVQKPYQRIAIAECGEPLVPIDLPGVVPVEPHPYAALGAPYGDRSPFWLRLGIVERLAIAAAALGDCAPGWSIQIFDAYRPLAVQRFMVEHAFGELAIAAGLDPQALARCPNDPLTRQLRDRVAEFWATPSDDPATPPPHSTGAALDVTLLDGTGTAVEMGSPIDECSPRSYPDHFAGATDGAGRRAHGHRQRLAQVMGAAGFVQHPNEWWHFSWGDQLWAWQTGAAIARYGRY